MENIVSYRVVDYKGSDGEWKNTDPKGSVTTDGSRMGQGDEPPTTQEIQESPYVNVGFWDSDGNIIYKWITGPFTDTFWIEDAIEEIADEYSISLGSE